MQLTCRLIFVPFGCGARNCQSWVIPFQKLGHHQNYLSRRTLKLVNVSMVPQLATAESLLGTSSKPTIPEKNTEQIWVCLKIWYPIHRSSPKTSPGSSSLRIQEPPNLFFWSIVAAALLSLVGVVAYLFISRSAAAAAYRAQRRPRGHWSGRSCRTWQRHKHRCYCNSVSPLVKLMIWRWINTYDHYNWGMTVMMIHKSHLCWESWVFDFLFWLRVYVSLWCGELFERKLTRDGPYVKPHQKEGTEQSVTKSHNAN